MDLVLRISKHVACIPIKCMLNEGVVTPTRALHSVRYLPPSPPPRALISISSMTYIFRERSCIVWVSRLFSQSGRGALLGKHESNH